MEAILLLQFFMFVGAVIAGAIYVKKASQTIATQAKSIQDMIEYVQDCRRELKKTENLLREDLRQIEEMQARIDRYESIYGEL